MELRDPVAVYDAANNLEAAVVCQILTSSGIAAYAVEDASVVGQWAFGLLPQIHNPQVWIERADLARAKPILENYERRRKEDSDAAHETAPIQVICEECHKQLEFPASRRGSVETCVHCGAYVDVGDVEVDGWEESEEQED
ncbi:MAG TPA: DUF2007 domain-containing protein [Lacipirellulaceae bacterium]